MERNGNKIESTHIHPFKWNFITSKETTTLSVKPIFGWRSLLNRYFDMCVCVWGYICWLVRRCVGPLEGFPACVCVQLALWFCLFLFGVVWFLLFLFSICWQSTIDEWNENPYGIRHIKLIYYLNTYAMCVHQFSLFYGGRWGWS